MQIFNYIAILCVIVANVEAYGSLIYFKEDEQIVKPCINPNGHLGKCIPLEECDALQYILRNDFVYSNRFLRMSYCENNALPRAKHPPVCCTNDKYFADTTSGDIFFPDNEEPHEGSTTSSITTAKPQKDDLSTLEQLLIPFTTEKNPIFPVPTESTHDNILQKFPKPPYCGAIALAPKIYGGVETELNEFPWMVNLEYRNASGQLVTACAGSLINSRYVLTAAHCIEGEIQLKIGPIESIRLGDHNTATDIDCNGLTCNEPFQRVGIQDIIVHEEFGDNDDLKIRNHHDIALLRMDRDINFSNSIQPVCLPNVEQPITELRSNMMLTVAGWGHNGTVQHTNEKRKVSLPYVEHEKCQHLVSNKINIVKEQLCAGGIFFQDSCSGDSGGPLMRLGKRAWCLEGIVSFGRGCGLERPGVYTRVRYYLDWIDEHVAL